MSRKDTHFIWISHAEEDAHAMRNDTKRDFGNPTEVRITKNAPRAAARCGGRRLAFDDAGQHVGGVVPTVGAELAPVGRQMGVHRAKAATSPAGKRSRCSTVAEFERMRASCSRSGGTIRCARRGCAPARAPRKAAAAVVASRWPPGAYRSGEAGRRPSAR